MLPKTLGELKQDSRFPHRFRSIKDEVRSNLLAKIGGEEDLFPGIIGYEETAIPAILNALLSRHNFILLGLRGQAKSRILRQLTSFLDPQIACIEGCEIHDDPFHPICSICQRRVREEGDELPVRFVPRNNRFVEKLATPDVTIADIIGDLDPIKAAKAGQDLSAVENIHFGLLPRAHRSIFAINELPDLAPKIQVGLFNILQEGDVQIKGFPIRMPLDVLMVFTANPEDYTARGKIITPLKDRIGAEVRTHYPARLRDGIHITRQEAWIERSGGLPLKIPDFVEEVVEAIAFEGRKDERIDHRSGVSQRLPISCLECALSNAERRAVQFGEKEAVVRVADIYAALPSITGKLELEYEGELRGAEAIAHELIRMAVLKAFVKRFGKQQFDQIVQWFDLGGELAVSDQTSADELCAKVSSIQGMAQPLKKLGVRSKSSPPRKAAAMEFVLEGLHSQKRISRNAQRGYYREAPEPDRELLETLRQRGQRSFN